MKHYSDSILLFCFSSFCFLTVSFILLFSANSNSLSTWCSVCVFLEKLERWHHKFAVITRVFKILVNREHVITNILFPKSHNIGLFCDLSHCLLLMTYDRTDLKDILFPNEWIEYAWQGFLLNWLHMDTFCKEIIFVREYFFYEVLILFVKWI